MCIDGRNLLTASSHGSKDRRTTGDQGTAGPGRTMGAGDLGTSGAGDWATQKKGEKMREKKGSRNTRPAFQRLPEHQNTVSTIQSWPAARDGACRSECCCESVSPDGRRGRGSRLYHPAPKQADLVTW